jgi:protein-S-isoprenylcysteine O-methyltransferase Ste14
MEGQDPPPYFQYLFFPRGVPKLKELREEAPRSTHLLVSIAAALTGVFFLFCGVALAFDADWSRISQPLLAAAICTVLGGVGAAFIYLAWRLLSFGRRLPTNVA